HTFQACSFSHSDTSPYCHPDAVGTGANVGERPIGVNVNLALFGAFKQTSYKMRLKQPFFIWSHDP
ncbi:hypothetical protein ACVZI5_002650, partial [Cronobacter sakazakii]